jgi:response regulator RpfG family c-di-GMP phosphodiesterase
VLPPEAHPPELEAPLVPAPAVPAAPAALAEPIRADAPEETLRVQLQIYARELRDLLRGARTTHETIEPVMAQLQACSADLQALMQSSQQAITLLERSCVNTLTWLIDAVDRRDQESRGHSQRVAVYARILGEALGLGPEESARLALAGRLHDAGKVEWPDALLLKQGVPSGEERTAIQMHCQLGAALEGTPSALLSTIAEVIAHHHEHWDGSGYPNGLAREAIPLSARVIQLVDVYDTLRARYRYKLTQSHAAACRAILQGDRCVSPEHFDPYLLEAFGRAAPHLANPELLVQ